MSPSLGWIASGTNEEGESADRGTGCANVRTSGSVGALVGNRQGHPARSELQAGDIFYLGLASENHETVTVEFLKQILAMRCCPPVIAVQRVLAARCRR
jgi:hypothetical protein